eukprot:3047361-Pleurochrysis_carterae.AAC.1
MAYGQESIGSVRQPQVPTSSHTVSSMAGQYNRRPYYVIRAIEAAAARPSPYTRKLRKEAS